MSVPVYQTCKNSKKADKFTFLLFLFPAGILKRKRRMNSKKIFRPLRGAVKTLIKEKRLKSD